MKAGIQSLVYFSVLDFSVSGSGRNSTCFPRSAAYDLNNSGAYGICEFVRLNI
jgi:hypothetical protein